nr:hypothetical protein BaRGS_031794 [Batillaria attramentaria]
MNDPMASTSSCSSSPTSSVEDMSVSETESQTVPSSRRHCDKYNLRRSSLRVRAQTEQKTRQPKERKPKSRPPPLSKYRRRSANARERCRMQEMNEAFEDLKKALPQAGLEASGGEVNPKCKGQPTKITVLRLAINYINALSDILGYHSDGDVMSDDLGSDAASTSTNCTTSGSGDDESLVSSDADTGVSDLEFFAPDLVPDFPPGFEADLGVTLSPEEEMCLELVASVL